MEVKYYSIEAAKERLSKIPENIYKEFETEDRSKLFSGMIGEVKRRCDNLKGEDMHSYERMWNQIVFSQMMNFRRNNFYRYLTDPITEELKEYMTTISILDILQIFIDFSNVKTENKELYYRLIDLYQHITGTWRPKKKN